MELALKVAILKFGIVFSPVVFSLIVLRGFFDRIGWIFRIERLFCPFIL